MDGTMSLGADLKTIRPVFLTCKKGFLLSSKKTTYMVLLKLILATEQMGAEQNV